MDREQWTDLLERVSERGPTRAPGHYLTAELAAANEMLGAGCEDVLVVELGIAPLVQCCRERGLRVSSRQLDALGDVSGPFDAVACLDLLQYVPDLPAFLSGVVPIATRVLLLGVPAGEQAALALHGFEDSDEFVKACGLTELGEVSVGTVEEPTGRSFLARVQL